MDITQLAEISLESSAAVLLLVIISNATRLGTRPRFPALGWNLATRTVLPRPSSRFLTSSQ